MEAQRVGTCSGDGFGWVQVCYLLSVPSVSIYTTVFGSSAVVGVIQLMEMFRMHTQGVVHDYMGSPGR